MIAKALATRLATVPERAIEALPSLPANPWRRPRNVLPASAAAFGLGVAVGLGIALLLYLAPPELAASGEAEGEPRTGGESHPVARRYGTILARPHPCWVRFAPERDAGARHSPGGRGNLQNLQSAEMAGEKLSHRGARPRRDPGDPGARRLPEPGRLAEREPPRGSRDSSGRPSGTRRRSATCSKPSSTGSTGSSAGAPSSG